MYKKLALLIGLVVSLVFSSPAGADVAASTTIDKSNNGAITEQLNIIEEIDITMDEDADDTVVEYCSQASTIENFRNAGNEVAETMVGSSAIIEDVSFSGASGVMGINQSPGNINNQGNILALSFGNGEAPSLLQADCAVSSSASGNKSTAEISSRSDTIKDSAFSSATGIIGVNQAAGNMNNQSNIASICIGGSPVVAMCEAELDVVSSDNEIEWGGDVTMIDTITGDAFKGATGIIGVNQSSGDMNNVAQVVSIAVQVITLP